LMSELTLAPSFRFANAMEFRLLRITSRSQRRGEEEQAPVDQPAPCQQLSLRPA
jgi:hypothetical protein